MSASEQPSGSIQAMVDRCAADGGGEVVLGPGRRPIGELRLRSGTRLRLSKGCTLEGSLCIEDAEGLSIVGEGPDASRIEGGVRLLRARDIECRGFHAFYMPAADVDGVDLAFLTLHQPPQRQAEGSAIHFSWGRNIRMSDCDLESNDDVFCLKRAAENVVLTRTRLCGRLAAPFKIGTETDGVFRNIEFTDSIIEMSDRAAICIESMDGAEISDVRVERIKMHDVNVPIFIRLGERDSFCKGCGSIRDITIADIEGYGDTQDEGYGSCITGMPGHHVENVTIRDMNFTSRGGQPGALVGRQIPERVAVYPEFDNFGRLPAHGLYARHVRGLRLERASWTTRERDGRPAIVLEDVDGFDPVDTEQPQIRKAEAGEHEAMPEGDTEALLDVIRAAKPGETVTIEPGDYAVPRDELPIVIEAEGVTVRSAGGPETSRIRAIGARETEWKAGIPRGDLPNRGDSLIVIRADNVTVSGFSIRGAFHNIRIADVRGCCIESNRFEFTKRHHVYCHGGGGHRLIDNTSTGTNNNAFRLEECHDCTISGNLFDRDPGAVRLTSSCRASVADNKFMSISWHGIMLEDGANSNRIVGNLFANGRLTGIQVRGSTDIEITGNEFHGQKTESVMVDTDSSGVVLRRNSFHENRGTAVSNETEHPVDAAENWWGSPDGPGPGAEVDGNVLVDPWLSDSPIPEE